MIGSAMPRWQVVLPMKSTELAKSRFGGTRSGRRQLAIAMVRDTLAAITTASNVEGVLVVCEERADVESFELPGVAVLVHPKAGMNNAIGAGAQRLRSTRLGCNLAVLPGDLPYLRPTELDGTLARAARHRSAFVSDHLGCGTTLLTAQDGTPLRPAFGDGSRAAHRHLGAAELDVPRCSGLRHDVDTPADLRLEPSLGRRTRWVIERQQSLPTTAQS